MIEIVLSENLSVSWLLEEFRHGILRYLSVDECDGDLLIYARLT